MADFADLLTADQQAIGKALLPRPTTHLRTDEVSAV
jgi:hypothetical protein